MRNCTCTVPEIVDYGLSPLPWVRRFEHYIPRGGEVLDIACGGGRHSAYMLLKGHQVLGVDAMTDDIAPLVGTPGFTLEKRDLEADPWPYEPNRFSAIVVSYYLHREHFPHYFESLKPGGLFIMETFTEENTRRSGRPRSPDHFLYLGELARLMPEGAQMLAYDETDTEVGTAVARIVWRKPL